MDRRKKENIILLCMLLDVLMITTACMGVIWILSAGVEAVRNSQKAEALKSIELCATVGRSVAESASEATIDIPYVTDSPLVKTALAEVGNKGGKKFWSWYGFKNHEPWCACFVSWCAEQNGYLRKGKIPRFAYVPEGENWFRSRGRWKKAGKYVPKAGDLIFFRKKNEKTASHAGIVASVVGNRVYTVQGNWKDTCSKRDYKLDDARILGYGRVKESKKGTDA